MGNPTKSDVNQPTRSRQQTVLPAAWIVIGDVGLLYWFARYGGLVN